jgi:mono/diheme cytochrome c family protein
VARLIVRVLLYLGAALLVAVLVMSIYVSRNWDQTWDAPLPDLHASTDPAAIARGEYLVFGPAHCVECHVPSTADYDKFAMSGIKPALIGGFEFPAAPLGVLRSKNITPDNETGIGRYSDPQIARMLRYSVRPDGQASVLPLMPFGDMSDEDLVGILSWLRAQPPVRHEVATNEWTMIGKVMRTFVPTFKPRTDAHPTAVSPPQQPTKERGEYIARGVGNCVGCHSPLNQLTFVPNGPAFSGGVAMEPAIREGVDKTLWFAPPNLTPLKGSALMRFPDRETFVARFKVGGRKHQGSPMPWECFAQMAPEDVGALYEFLHSLPPTGEPSPEDPKVKP